MFTLRKATRQKTKVRIGLSGPSGAGKTYSALLLASGMAPWEKIALIDTENGSGDLYADLGAYNVITLTPDFTPERYIAAIKACEDAGMEVIIIDSTSHEWEGKGGCLESNEIIARTKFKGNTWAAWSDTTPRHQRFIQAIVQSSCTIITTARSKTDTIQTEDKKVKKVGLKEIQREGFEYELTLNFTLDRDGHYALASKDRTGMFIDVDPFKITKETGKKILQWSQEGNEALPPPPEVTQDTIEQPQVSILFPKEDGDVMRSADQSTQILELWGELMKTQNKAKELWDATREATMVKYYGVKSMNMLRSKQAAHFIDMIIKKIEEEKAKAKPTMVQPEAGEYDIMKDLERRQLLDDNYDKAQLAQFAKTTHGITLKMPWNKPDLIDAIMAKEMPNAPKKELVTA